LIKELNNISKTQFVFKHIRELYPAKFNFEQLTQHRAIVLFPYAVMSYSIVDFYAINMPIFVPSKEFLIKLNILNERRLQSHACLKMPDQVVFDRKYNFTSHPYSPNSNDYKAISYWLQFADYYLWPFVTTFDSFEDLLQKLKKADLSAISSKMKAHNLVREADLLNNWCQLTKSIVKSPRTPSSYEEALLYYQVKNFENNDLI